METIHNSRTSVLLLILFYFPYSGFGDDTNSSCNCVPYYQCSDDSGNILTDGFDLFDLRTFKGDACSGYFDVCCNIVKSFLEVPTEKRYGPEGCGYSGTESFPWTAALYYQMSAELTPAQKCGASLIHPQVAITAAHCVSFAFQPSIWIIRIGNLQRSVKKIKIHENYNSATLQNDLALLILNHPVSISDKVNVICIPSPTYIYDDKSLCTLSSWNNDRKKLVELPLVSKETCVNLYRINSGLGVFFQLHESFMCAGGEVNKDACVGDGGSPLVCPITNQPGRYQQVGIVTWGVGCGEFNLPGVYVNLAVFRGWIDEFMTENKFDMNIYTY